MSFVTEAAVLLVMARRGRAGTTLVRRILLHYGRTHTPTESDTETIFLELCEEYELPPSKRQVPISGFDGFIGRVDFCWPEARLVVEIDSTEHDGPEDKLADAERDRRMEAEGWTVKRYRFDELVGNPAKIARELLAILEA